MKLCFIFRRELDTFVPQRVDGHAYHKHGGCGENGHERVHARKWCVERNIASQLVIDTMGHGRSWCMYQRRPID